MKIFSPIQNHIISKLKNADSLRYSELQPEEKIGNDLFNYHLQYLVKHGVVEKTDNKYGLSESGIQYIANPVPADFDPEGKIGGLFKVNVITIVSRDVDGQIQVLNQLRKSNPSYGKVGVMGGVVNVGETLEEAAKRKLEEETGLIAEFKSVGVTRRIMYQGDALFSDVFFPIMYADTITGGELMEETEFGDNFWVDIDQALENDKPRFDSIKGIYKVLEAVKNKEIENTPFFFEEDIHR